MALQFVITTAGREALVNAANTGTAAVEITEIALGSTYAEATAARTALTTEIKRVPTTGGGTVAPDTIHVTGRDTSADEYAVKEIGLYTSAGVLLAIYSNAAPFITKGAGTVALLACDLILTGLPAGSVTVGDITLANPPATETVAGVAEIATEEETLEGTDDTRIVTPKKLWKLTSTAVRRGLIRLATAAEVITGTDAEKAVTPATLAARTATTDRRGLVEIATNAEAAAGNDSERALTPSHLSTIAGEFFKMLYPVGEILITRREGAPSTWLGFGTWERYGAGRVLVGYNAADTDFNALDKTGGAKTITLSVGELPAHGHTVGPFNAVTSTAGGHRHLLERKNNDFYNEGGGTGPTGPGGDIDLEGSGNKPIVRTTEAGAHEHTVTIDATISGQAGGGGAHSNVQPFIVVYMWRRIS